LLNTNYNLQIAPHTITHITSNLPSSFGSISLTQTHHTYKRLLGWNKEYESAYGKRILILDTGVDVTIDNVIERKNFVEPNKDSDVTDDNGHGTVVTKIIQDLCPMVEIIMYKVADQKGRASEWDTLAALAAKSKADIINMSLAFGL